MDELVKMLDANLNYLRHEIDKDTFYIYVISNRREVACFFCGRSSCKVHSRYQRRFQDLPIQGKKTVIVLFNRKMFCNNPECEHRTFAESFDFLQHKAKKTFRLKDEIIRIALSQSSLSASEYLRNSVADVGKSTICNYLKKMHTNHR